jgi:hypothetical protein
VNAKRPFRYGGSTSCNMFLDLKKTSLPCFGSTSTMAFAVAPVSSSSSVPRKMRRAPPSVDVFQSLGVRYKIQVRSRHRCSESDNQAASSSMLRRRKGLLSRCATYRPPPWLCVLVLKDDARSARAGHRKERPGQYRRRRHGVVVVTRRPRPQHPGKGTA